MKKLERRAKKLLLEIEEMKDKYRELEEITLQLKKLKFKANNHIILIDNFKNKNTVFRATSVKRYEIKLQ